MTMELPTLNLILQLDLTYGRLNLFEIRDRETGLLLDLTFELRNMVQTQAVTSATFHLPLSA